VGELVGGRRVAADGGCAGRGGDVLELSFHRLWGGERRTIFSAKHRPCQLDHMIATKDVGALLTSAEIDSSWSEEEVHRGAISDHAPIRFTLR
jgi:hypothetical protein